jgi:hypothetical protein
LGEKPEGKRTLGKPRNRLDNITNMNLKHIGWDGINFIYLNLDRNKW